MKVGGLVKTSLLDYPGKISTVVFTQGCNLRCYYCHNASLLDFHKLSGLITEEEIFNYLDRRKNLIDGVVVSGGEPTLQPDLEEFICKIKEKGYLVKLDTNGTSPRVIESLLQKGLLDYLAMDIKATTGMYSHISGKFVDVSLIEKSVAIIKSSGVPYHFRTTMAPCLGQIEIQDIRQWIGINEKLVLQELRQY